MVNGSYLPYGLGVSGLSLKNKRNIIYDLFFLYSNGCCSIVMYSCWDISYRFNA